MEEEAKGQLDAYVLMAGVRKHNDRKAGKGGYNALPMDDVDLPSLGESVTLGEVVDHQNDQIANGNEGNHARVFERI